VRAVRLKAAVKLGYGTAYRKVSPLSGAQPANLAGREENSDGIVETLIEDARSEYAHHEIEEPILLDGTSEMHARNSLGHLLNERWDAALKEAKIAAGQTYCWRKSSVAVHPRCRSVSAGSACATSLTRPAKDSYSGKYVSSAILISRRVSRTTSATDITKSKVSSADSSRWFSTN